MNLGLGVLLICVLAFVALVAFVCFVFIKSSRENAEVVNSSLNIEETTESISQKNGDMIPGDKWYIHGMAAHEDGVRGDGSL